MTMGASTGAKTVGGLARRTGGSIAPRARDQRLAIGVVLLLAPGLARAHGEQIVFFFLYFPVLAVAGSLIIGAFSWQASRGAKGRAVLFVASASALIFIINYAFDGLAIVMRLGRGAYLAGVMAQLAVPALVWWVCKRTASRRSHEGRGNPG
jgi:uncharacterized membrane protein